jgi:hypothetical protein
LLRQDALLYLWSAVFAAGVLVGAGSADYREWAAMALGPYFAAAVLSELVVRVRARTNAAGGASGAPPTGDVVGARQPRRGPGPGPSPGDREQRTGAVRAATILTLLVLTVVTPLAFQLVWRAHAHAGAQAQVEVAVIERAGDRAAAGHNPYLRHPRTVGISPSSDARSIDRNSYFAYLPGMVPFGMANALSGPSELGDARLTMSGFTVLVTVLALLLSRGRVDRRWRVFQVLIVLPTGALPLVTGGDDLPVLALMLLGVVLAAQRRPIWSGVVMGLAGTLKFTAWGLLLLVAFGVYDRSGRRAAARYLAAAAAITVPVIGLGIALGPHAFVENVISFPLGLTSVHSPAASPLPGQELVSLLPHWKKAITALLLVLGGSIVLVAFVRRPPRTPAAAVRFTAFAAMLAVLLAPATRFGYLIYPMNLLIWASLVDEPAGVIVGARPDPAGADGSASAGRSKPQLASPTW